MNQENKLAMRLSQDKMLGKVYWENAFSRSIFSQLLQRLVKQHIFVMLELIGFASLSPILTTTWSLLKKVIAVAALVFFRFAQLARFARYNTDQHSVVLKFVAQNKRFFFKLLDGSFAQKVTSHQVQTKLVRFPPFALKLAEYLDLFQSIVPLYISFGK